jgi:hypothetical protein
MASHDPADKAPANLHGDDNRDTGDSRLQQQLNDAYTRLPRRLIMQAVYRP